MVPSASLTRRDYQTSEAASRRMQRVRGENTRPELLVRRLLRQLGVAYRLHDAELPGRPDIVMRRRRCAIFVHGCFWHRHRCRAGRSHPATNLRLWQDKFARTRERDRKQKAALRRQGWRVLVIWECQLRNPEVVKRKTRSFLDGAGAAEPLKRVQE